MDVLSLHFEARCMRLLRDHVERVGMCVTACMPYSVSMYCNWTICWILDAVLSNGSAMVRVQSQ